MYRNAGSRSCSVIRGKRAVPSLNPRRPRATNSALAIDLAPSGNRGRSMLAIPRRVFLVAISPEGGPVMLIVSFVGRDRRSRRAVRLMCPFGMMRCR